MALGVAVGVALRVAVGVGLRAVVTQHCNLLH